MTKRDFYLTMSCRLTGTFPYIFFSILLIDWGEVNVKLILLSFIEYDKKYENRKAL